ncbi:pentapeptide repeat-containing protein [Pantoea sp. B65]|uniref:pentapeptide repeat-containing protein n=1 Tax=Pantoea sp. B65 TaxID=2813359 RepID=UPI0039B55436
MFLSPIASSSVSPDSDSNPLAPPSDLAILQRPMPENAGAVETEELQIAKYQALENRLKDHSINYPLRLSNIDLSGMDLSKLDKKLEGIIIEDSQLQNTIMNGISLLYCRFEKVDLSNSQLTGCDMQSVVFIDVNMQKSRLENVNFANADLQRVDWLGAHLQDIRNLQFCQNITLALPNEWDNDSLDLYFNTHRAQGCLLSNIDQLTNESDSDSASDSSSGINYFPHRTFYVGQVNNHDLANIDDFSDVEDIDVFYNTDGTDDDDNDNDDKHSSNFSDIQDNRRFSTDFNVVIDIEDNYARAKQILVRQMISALNWGTPQAPLDISSVAEQIKERLAKPLYREDEELNTLLKELNVTPSLLPDDDSANGDNLF